MPGSSPTSKYEFGNVKTTGRGKATLGSHNVNNTYNWNFIGEHPKQSSISDKLEALAQEESAKFKMFELPNDFSPHLMHHVRDLEHFKACLDGKYQTLVLRGKPGCGKSTTVLGLVEVLREHKVHTAVALFESDAPGTHNAAQTLTLLVKQLVDQNPDAKELANSLINGNKLTRNVKDISKVLVEVISEAPRACIFLDGIDEFNDAGERDMLLDSVQDVQFRTAVGIIITERTGESDCAGRFEGSPFVKEEKNIYAQRADIRQYIETRFGRIKKRWLDETRSKSLGKVEEVVTRNSKGVFVLARLFTDYAANVDSLSQLNKALRDIDNICNGITCEERYIEAVVEKAFTGQLSPTREHTGNPRSEEYAIRTFRYLRDATRAMTYEELQRAMQMQDRHPLQPSNELLAWDTIQRYCLGLIETRSDGSIRFIHKLLMQHLSSERVRAQFESAHAELGFACVRYMSLVELTPDGICANKSELEERLRNEPFLNYAARYWAEHFQSVFSNKRDVSDPASQRFLNATLDFLQDSKKIDCAWQIMQTDDPIRTALAKLALQAEPAQELNISVIWQDGPSPIKLSEPYASNQVTGLHLACFHGFNMLVRRLLNDSKTQKRCSVNDEDFRGRTPLYMAAYAGREEVVKTLLEANANPYLGDNWNITPLHVAAGRGFPKIVEQLLKYKKAQLVDPNTQSQRDPQKRRSRLDFLLWSVNWPWKAKASISNAVWGRTALHSAASRGCAESVRLLTQDQRIKPDLVDCHGMTALHKAAKYGHLEIMKTLVAKIPPHTPSQIPSSGTENEEIKNMEGCTSLHIASMEGRVEVVEYLVKVPGLCDALDELGRTALHYAAYHHRTSVLNILLGEVNLDPNQIDQGEDTALISVLRNGEQSRTAIGNAFFLLWNHERIDGRKDARQRDILATLARDLGLSVIKTAVMEEEQAYAREASEHQSAPRAQHRPKRSSNASSSIASRQARSSTDRSQTSLTRPLVRLSIGRSSLQDSGDSAGSGSVTPIPEVFHQTGFMAVTNPGYNPTYPNNSVDDVLVNSIVYTFERRSTGFSDFRA